MLERLAGNDALKAELGTALRGGLRIVGSTVAALVAVSRNSTPSGGSSMIFSIALADDPFRFCAP